MSLQPFFENFALLADAPNGVVELRDLVLQLAARGKLTSQDAKDEEATLLAKRILQERVRLTNGKATKRIEGRRGIQPDEAPYSLPSTWIWQRLEDVFYPISVGQNKIKSSEVDESGKFPVVDQGKNYIAGYTDDESRLIRIPGPVIVFGDHTCELKFIDFDFVAGADGVKILRPIEVYEPYFFRVVQTFGVAERGYSRHYKFFLDNLFPLPPLEEQKRIVAKVDEMMRLCDQLEARQQARRESRVRLNKARLAPLNKAASLAPEDVSGAANRLADNFATLYDSAETVGELRSIVLQLAVQGRLVPQDPSDEPAGQTLAKVLRSRERQAKRLRIKNPRPVVADEAHTPCPPKGWCYASPDQLTAFHKNALTIGPFGSSLLRSDYTDGGVPLVFVRDIRSESFGGPETRFVSTEKAAELASHTVKSGDLLITKMGDPPGDSAIYPEGRPPAIITADCIKLTPHRDLVSAEYLRFVIRASQIAEQFAGITLGVAQQKVSLGRFRCIAVPLPPLAEQRRIVAKVDQLMALCDGLESKLRQAEANSEKLMNAAVQHVLAAVSQKSTEDLAKVPA